MSFFVEVDFTGLMTPTPLYVFRFELFRPAEMTAISTQWPSGSWIRWSESLSDLESISAGNPASFKSALDVVEIVDLEAEMIDAFLLVVAFDFDERDVDVAVRHINRAAESALGFQAEYLSDKTPPSSRDFSSSPPHV